MRERNPSLAAMSAAWQAAAERYPQAVSLEDPKLSVAMGPGTFGDPTHDVAWMVEGSQKFPWPGKRDLRGQQAQAEASAARLDLDDAEVRLIAATRLALWDYYLVRRQEELNGENRVAVGHFRDTALSKYRAGQVTQQDVLEADVELAEIERRQFELNRIDTVSVARINTLLHRAGRSFAAAAAKPSADGGCRCAADRVAATIRRRAPARSGANRRPVAGGTGGHRFGGARLLSGPRNGRPVRRFLARGR